MDEKPGVTPIFDTIIPSSSDGIYFANKRLPLSRPRPRLRLIRVPDGALTLMTNMAGVGSGEKRKPSLGN